MYTEENFFGGYMLIQHCVFQTVPVYIACRLIAFISLNQTASSQEVSDPAEPRNVRNSRNVRNADLQLTPILSGRSKLFWGGPWHLLLTSIRAPRIHLSLSLSYTQNQNPNFKSRNCGAQILYYRGVTVTPWIQTLTFSLLKICWNCGNLSGNGTHAFMSECDTAVWLAQPSTHLRNP